MRRFVYSPYVQAFIKSEDGVFDVSPYIVRSAVNRKVNQVSSAQLTLRNPVQSNSNRLLFTEYSGKGEPPHPLFRPMDPIIILLQRLQGHPVQVFTGYLDKAPYLQLFPGLCSVEASCTLKRLLYTQWDAALPAVQNFLGQFGWFPNGSGIWNPGADNGSGIQGLNGKIQGQFTDGSIGALLFAVLNHIGDWDSSTIWIEALPPQIKDLIVNLYTAIEPEVKQGENQFQSLIQQILGSNTFGTGSPTGPGGGTPSGPVKGASAIVHTVAPIAAKYNVPLQMVLAVMFIETGFTNQDSPGNPHYGWFQAQTASPPYRYGTWSTSAPTVSEAHDLGLSATAFCSAAAGWAQADPSLRSDIQQWAMDTQGVTASNNPYYVTGWPNAIATADSYISKYASPGTKSGSASSAPSATAHKASATATIAQATRSPGGKTGATSNAIYALPLDRKYMSPLGRTDDGVDIENAPDGATVYSITDGIVTAIASNPTGFGPNYPVIQATNGPYAGQYIYYGHVASALVQTNQHVTAGQPIAIIGHTGDAASLGHGHIEIGFSNSTGDPLSHHGASATTPDGLRMRTLLTALINGNTLPQQANAFGGSGTGSGGGGTSMAAAFSTFINLPSIFSMAEAQVFTGKRSFIADQPLFPFIDQLCKASLRNFMSMPNGNFFAFFPDYFGFFGRKYYWEIHDIEIIDGRIDLSDDPLRTHVAVAGDVTQYHGTVDFTDLVLTSGIFDIFDAFATGYIGQIGVHTIGSKFDPAIGKAAAVEFLQRYGARPYVEEVPAIRSPFFELFLAFQTFMISWSQQYKTTFELTFMPEVFPGGLIYLADHHIQCYVEEVVHNCDYESGFTTTVSLSSPSIPSGDRQAPQNLSQGLATNAVVGQVSSTVSTSVANTIKKIVQNALNP